VVKPIPHYHRNWVLEFEAAVGEYLEKFSDQESQLLNLDGKCVRGTVSEETGKQLHLLSLQESSKNLVTAQTALESTENEISAAKRLLREANVTGKIVSGDAIFTHKELAVQVRGKEGEYLWKLRANQEAMYEEAKEYFGAVKGKAKLPMDVARARSIDKGHGRIEEREILTTWRLANWWEFPALEQVFQIRRKSEEVKTGKKSEQVIYGITSLPVPEYGAEELLELTSKHWSIENGLHYRRDVTFKEDRVRQKSLRGGQVLAILNNLVIGLLRKVGWENLAQARRYYDAQMDKALILIMNTLLL